MGRPRKWTEEDRAYLRANYGVLTIDQIAAHLGRVPSAVKAQRGQMGLKLPGYGKPQAREGERPCSCCGKPFKVRPHRRMLCDGCYRRGG